MQLKRESSTSLVNCYESRHPIVLSHRCLAKYRIWMAQHVHRPQIKDSERWGAQGINSNRTVSGLPWIILISNLTTSVRVCHQAARLCFSLRLLQSCPIIARAPLSTSRCVVFVIRASRSRALFIRPQRTDGESLVHLLRSRFRSLLRAKERRPHQLLQMQQTTRRA